MGLFDFLKKKPEAEDKLSLDDLSIFIEKKKNENQEKEAELIQIIKNQVLELVKDLEEKKTVLNSIDISNKKADERAKLIIRENLRHYTLNLEKLINHLEILEYSEVTSIVKDIDSLIIDFQEKSRMHYEKATFLIGKELGEVKGAIDGFAKNLKRILNNNKKLLENSEIIFVLEKKSAELSEVAGILGKLHEKENDSYLNSLREKVKNYQLEIERHKNSREYIEEKNKIREIHEKENELEREIYKLKDMIDFKQLANIFHYDSKKMNLVNEYKMNFLSTFKKNNGISILKILEEANLNDSFIIQKMNELVHKNREKEKMINQSKDIQEEKIQKIQKEITSLVLEIEEANSARQKEEKAAEKYMEKRKEIFSDIKLNLLKMGIEIKGS